MSGYLKEERELALQGSFREKYSNVRPSITKKTTKEKYESKGGHVSGQGRKQQGSRLQIHSENLVCQWAFSKSQARTPHIGLYTLRAAFRKAAVMAASAVGELAAVATIIISRDCGM